MLTLQLNFISILVSFLRDTIWVLCKIDTLYWCTCWNMSIYPHVRGMFTLPFNSPRYSRSPESHSSGFLYSALGCYCGWGGRGWVWDRYKGMRMGIKKEPVIRIGFVNPFDKQTMETPSFWTFTHYQHHPRYVRAGVYVMNVNTSHPSTSPSSPNGEKVRGSPKVSPAAELPTECETVVVVASWNWIFLVFTQFCPVRSLSFVSQWKWIH